VSGGIDLLVNLKESASNRKYFKSKKTTKVTVIYPFLKINLKNKMLS
jgi:hypothetical protein